jgi:amino acid adenylation domain-containing protein
MSHESVTLLFDKAAARAPGRIALSCGGLDLTYAELRGAADRLARRLLSAGAGKGSVVAILLDDTVAAITSIIAVLKASAVFVPLDPQIPARRLDAMVEDVAPDWFITGPESLDRLGGFPPSRVLCLDGRRELFEAGGAQELGSGGDAPLPPVASAPDDHCYIYFTSGSTGRPKGIAGRLKGIDHFIRWEIETLGLGEGSRVSQLLPLSFDGSLRDIFVPLCSGGTLCVPEDAELVPDARRLIDWLDGRMINVVHCVPSLFRALLNGGVGPEHFKALRYVLLSGEPLLPSDVGRWMDVFGERVQLINLYGTSETTMAKFVYRVTAADRERRSIPVGKPMPGARALILNEQGRACPPGAIGEIYIRTPYRSLGYYKQPELTRQAFVPNPFSDDPDDIVYKTGDLGRMLEDGNVELLGRKDQQVKIRGVRVELEEIEGLLRGYPGVADVAVVDRDDASGNKYLCAYVVADAEPGLNALREHLQERLPNSMVPSAFVLMERLPRTISGKLDRRALPSPGHMLAQRRSECAAPATAIEEVLAGLWCEVLGLERVGSHDSFFELGGHSLLATQVLARAREVFHVEIPLRQLFEAPTIFGLAQSVEAALRSGPAGPSPRPIERVEGDELPLSYAQQRLWFIDQMGLNKAAYNVPGVLRLEGALNTHALEQTLSEIGRRHETLRTVFSSVGERPVQIITPPSELRLPLIDLMGVPPGERERVASRLARHEAQRPFDLSTGPLLRVRLLRLSEQTHWLVFVMHHIISDAWSMGVLVRETTALYTAYSQGAASGLPELAVQYADYAQWQRAWMDDEVRGRELDYWKRQLAGAPPVLELPADRPRPAVQSERGASRSVLIERDVVAALKRISRHEGATLFMTLLAAFDILLQRYTGQSDIIVGTPIANRTRSETNDLIGFFVNTLVLRTDMSGDPSFRQLLARVREMAFGAYAHQNLPFEKLVEELQPERNLSYTPLFQVILILHNAPVGTLKLPGLSLNMFEAESGTAKFDLTVNVEEVDGALSVSWTYNTDLFDAATIERMGGHFKTLLGAIAENINRGVSEFPLLTDAERRRFIAPPNQTAAPYPSEKCIQHLIEEQAGRNPGAAALLYEGEQVAYEELLRRADLLARHLRGRGVRPGVCVGVFLEHSVEAVVAILGVLKAGGAYVPLDPEHPRARLSFVLDDARIRVVLTQQSLADRLPADRPAQPICLDADWETVTAAPEPPPSPGATADDLAYVIYTSGSTGQPKGVKITHRALVNYIWWAKDVYARQEEASFALYSSLAFDLTVTSLFTPLITGNRLVIYGPARWQNPLTRILEENLVDVLKLTPSHLSLIKDRDNGACRVRRLIVGGEAFETELARQVHASFGGKVEILNEYGPTEATVGCMIYRYDAERDGRRFVPIGRPAANAQIYVLDEHLSPVPENIVGELYISGAGLAEGYLNLPALTAERFIAHPFIPGERLYRSGDLARWLPRGEVEYLGRGDEQVKYHGYRVELNEIRSALNLHPQIRDSVVLIRPDHNGRDVMIAYYVSRHELAAGQLREFLSEYVIRETIPNIFVHLKKLPLTLNGKVNHQALPSLKEIRGRGGQGEYEAPQTAVEEIVAGIWAELLGVARVSLHDNFFELGGHSLLATQAIARIRATLAVELPLRTLFELPTLLKLSGHVEAALGSGAASPLPPLVPAPRQESLPLTFAQQRLWFLDQLEPGSPAYNCPAAVRFTGALDIEALGQSFNEVVRRHEALRTTFAARAGEPLQIIVPSLRLPLPVVDLSGLPAAAREAEVSRLSLAESQRAFDLSRPPLLRVTLLRLGADEHVLLLVMHHIISDGWSIGVFVREVAALYAAYTGGVPSPLEELPVQYADFGYWQRRWLQGAVLEEQLNYWRRQLAGAAGVLELPTDRPRPKVQTYRGAYETFSLKCELSEALKLLSRRLGATLFMTLLSGFMSLLYRYTGQQEVVVGTGIANRSHPETERLIGFFVNMLVLRARLGDNPDFEQLIERVREVCLGAYAHQDVPFERLVEELQVERDMSRQPLFQAVFVLQNTPMPVLDLPRVRLGTVNIEGGMTHFDLTMSVAETAQGLVGTLEYNVDLFDAATIRRMLRHYEQVLEGMAAQPRQRLLELPLPRAEEEEEGASADEVVIFDAGLVAERDYWLERLAGLDASAVLPTPERVPPSGAQRNGPEGEAVEIKTDEGTLAALERLTGGSPFLLCTALLAALKVCLHKYTEAERVAVATPATAKLGRGNTVVIVDDVRDDQSFQELLLAVRESLLAAYGRQNYPYARLLKELDARRQDAQNDTGTKPAAGGLDAVALDLAGFHGEMTQGRRHALRLRFEVLAAGEADAAAAPERGGGGRPFGELRGAIEYDAKLYTRSEVETLSGHFAEALRAAVGQPGRLVGQLGMMTAAERELVLERWNKTEAPYPRQRCVHHLFEEQAERTPAAVAAAHGDRRLSYHELNARANRLARHLRTLGVGPEQTVGIMLGRSLEMLVGVLGVLKAGGSYVPLDVSYPRERRHFMMADAGVKVLLTERAWLDCVPEGPVRVVCLDEHAFDADDGTNLSAPVEGGNMAYVIYTSGSTGRPKGVMISHEGLMNYLFWACRAYRVAEGEGAILHSPLGFDLTLTSLFTPLLVGGRVVLVNEQEQLTELVETLGAATRPYSLLKVTPSHLEALRHMLGDRPLRVRCLVVGGEALHADEVRWWLEKSPSTRIVNEYGPTETVVGCCVYEVGVRGAGPEDEGGIGGGPHALGVGAVPIGRPIANVRLYILDPRQQPAAVSVPGELYVGGAGVARGYAGRPALTAERFLPDPFSPEGGARMYRTGDVARHRLDGQIEFLGRTDEQVKVRGYRIELAEIEAVLAQHEGVGECVVVAREDEPGAKRLVAYLTPAAHAPAAEDMRDYLRERLPEYMVPTAFVTLEAIPLTPNGKADRRALPLPEQTRPDLKSAYVAPRTPLEELLAGLWAEILGVERVGVEDNFFELGGHSLLATRLISRMREIFQIQLPLSSLFEAPTVAGLARLTRTGEAKQGQAERIAQMMKTIGGMSDEAVEEALQQRARGKTDSSESVRATLHERETVL